MRLMQWLLRDRVPKLHRAHLLQPLRREAGEQDDDLLPEAAVQALEVSLARVGDEDTRCEVQCAGEASLKQSPGAGAQFKGRPISVGALIHDDAVAGVASKLCGVHAGSMPIRGIMGNRARRPRCR